MNAADKKWFFLVLAWLFEKITNVSDPLSEVEAIYADFDDPPEIEAFVSYMPVTDGYDPSRVGWANGFIVCPRGISRKLVGYGKSGSRESQEHTEKGSGLAIMDRPNPVPQWTALPSYPRCPIAACSTMAMNAMIKACLSWSSPPVPSMI
ncbi:MAG: DUF2247 family protein [Methylococcales bacterium]